MPKSKMCYAKQVPMSFLALTMQVQFSFFVHLCKKAATPFLCVTIIWIRVILGKFWFVLNALKQESTTQLVPTQNMKILNSSLWISKNLVDEYHWYLQYQILLIHLKQVQCKSYICCPSSFLPVNWNDMQLYGFQYLRGKWYQDVRGRGHSVPTVSGFRRRREHYRGRRGWRFKSP